MQLRLRLPVHRVWRRQLCGALISVPLHVAVLVLLTTVASRVEQAGADEAQGDGGSLVVAYVAALPDEASQPAARALDGDRSLLDSVPVVAERSEHVDLGFSGYNFDISKIRGRKEALFLILTTDLSFLSSIADELRSPKRPLVNPFASRIPGPADGSAGAQRLQLSDGDLQRLVDESWSRRERWKKFAAIAELVGRGGDQPQGGRVPELIRGYLDQNILQPYCEAVPNFPASRVKVRDPMMWAMLENASDHQDFVDFIRSYARTHPSSRTTTELLFLLDELTQASRDALLILIDTKPFEELERTREANPAAFMLVREIQENYRDWLREHGLTTADAIKERYDAIRLRLLGAILETTPDGYRAADARFLGGEILFRRGRLADALDMWRGIRGDERDTYVSAYAQIAQLLKNNSEPDPRVIQRILDRDRGRWWELSYNRLRRFGFACDTF